MGFRDVQCRVHVAENRLFDRGLSNKVSMKKKNGSGEGEPVIYTQSRCPGSQRGHSGLSARFGALSPTLINTEKNDKRRLQNLKQ